MKTIKLTADNFTKQVTEFGFFAEAVRREKSKPVRKMANKCFQG